MVRTFSGEPTADLNALDAALAESRSVRITADGCLVHAVDPQADVLDPATEKHVVLMRDEPLAHVSGHAEMADLRRLMSVAEFSDFACMCPGDLALEFLDAQGERLAVVRFDAPGWLDWALWAGRGRVRDPRGLQEWLVAHGGDAQRVGLAD